MPFHLKGFTEPVPVYRLEPTHRTRVISDEISLVLDLRGFARFVEANSIATVERVLEALFRLTHRIAAEFDGTVRISGGDSYLLSFAKATSALAAAEQLLLRWEDIRRGEGYPCSVNIGMHQGTVYGYRSFLYGPGYEVAAEVQAKTKQLLLPDEGAIFLTKAVREALAETTWAARLKPVRVTISRAPDISVFDLEQD